MNDHHNDNIELAGAYVLDALEPNELMAFEAHLITCPTCRAEVYDLQQVVDVLPLAVEILEPPDSLRSRILQEIESEPAPEPRSRLTILPTTAPARDGTVARTSRWRATETWLAAVAAVVILALGAWNVQLHQQSSHNSSPSVDLLEAIKNGATVSPVANTRQAPGAVAELVQPRNGAPALLAVRNLPKTPSNRVYEIWLLRGRTPVKAGLFSYSGGADWQVVRLPTASNGYVATAVTNEPSPNGSPAPTGQQYLLGKLGA